VRLLDYGVSSCPVSSKYHSCSGIRHQAFYKQTKQINMYMVVQTRKLTQAYVRVSWWSEKPRAWYTYFSRSNFRKQKKYHTFVGRTFLNVVNTILCSAVPFKHCEYQVLFFQLHLENDCWVVLQVRLCLQNHWSAMLSIRLCWYHLSFEIAGLLWFSFAQTHRCREAPYANLVYIYSQSGDY